MHTKKIPEFFDNSSLKIKRRAIQTLWAEETVPRFDENKLSKDQSDIFDEVIQEFENYLGNVLDWKGEGIRNSIEVGKKFNNSEVQLLLCDLHTYLGDLWFKRHKLQTQADPESELSRIYAEKAAVEYLTAIGVNEVSLYLTRQLLSLSPSKLDSMHLFYKLLSVDPTEGNTGHEDLRNYLSLLVTEANSPINYLANVLLQKFETKSTKVKEQNKSDCISEFLDSLREWLRWDSEWDASSIQSVIGCSFAAHRYVVLVEEAKSGRKIALRPKMKKTLLYLLLKAIQVVLEEFVVEYEISDDIKPSILSIELPILLLTANHKIWRSEKLPSKDAPEFRENLLLISDICNSVVSGATGDKEALCISTLSLDSIFPPLFDFPIHLFLEEKEILYYPNYRTDYDGSEEIVALLRIQGCLEFLLTNLDDTPPSMEEVDSSSSLISEDEPIEKFHNQFIALDASNIALEHGNWECFSAQGIQEASNYFRRKGYRVKAFLPDYALKETSDFSHYDKNGKSRRTFSKTSESTNILRRMLKEQIVVLVPSQNASLTYAAHFAKSQGANLVTNDDMFVLKSGPGAAREKCELSRFHFDEKGKFQIV